MVHSANNPLQHLMLAQDHPLPVLARWALAFAVLVTKWDTRARTRRALSKLDTNGLRDIGISLDDARAEAARKFWQS